MVNRTCSIKGCDEPHAAKGKCHRHYYQGYKRRRGVECSIDDCTAFVVGRGWCTKHYQRWQKFGDPLAVAQIVGNDEERFWSKVDTNGPVPAHRPELGPCWVWTGPTNADGYGRFSVGTQEIHAARYICEMRIGPIPDGYEPDHLCKKTSCVNYFSHIEVVTQRENILRSSSPPALNAAKTHCDSGHEFTPENTIVRKRAGGGRTCRECARAADRRYQQKKRARAMAA